ncbi:MAG: hypothetical protein JSU87_14790 [Gemmatimonadota bacterium]|nr:MAG: hypothetical protein JSU87_14790 [Gemmatimonadota bacterium]
MSHSAEGLEGEYELTLVAAAGEAEGRSASGRLWLYANAPEMRALPAAAGGVRSDASAPLYGATDVAPEAVGGLRLGDPMSRDPEKPGVLLVQQNGRIVLRVGSEANRRGLLRFDGGYFVLRVQEVTDAGFAGTWASGLLEVQAQGHFCATALGD